MKLTHLDDSGNARMVDIGNKPRAERRAVAVGKVFVSKQVRELLQESGLPKGNPFEVARIAAVQAAKKTSELIPLCHSLNLDWVDVEIVLEDDAFAIRCEVRCRWATGVEMEALTGVSVAALTLYDMCKAVDKTMRIGEIRLLRKEKRPLEGEQEGA